MRSSVLQLLTFGVFLRTQTALGQYKLVQDYSGQDFFSKWDFDNGIDNTTGGNVQYVGQNIATQQNLAFVDSSSGRAIVRVDNTSKIDAGPSVQRSSVKITSKDAYPIGSLIIIDAIHIPYGCSVQPVFSTLGTELALPDAGEINIIDGINGVTTNNMAMHTGAGCSQSSNVSQFAQIGKTLEKDCGTTVGCKVEETKAKSYGVGFAQAGGGVFAARIDVSGVFIWFWSRLDIPTSISNAKADTAMDTSDWGQPSAAYPSADCNIEKFFKPQKLVLDITLCGQWAGNQSIYSETCPGECITNVIGDGSNYGTAYWGISYVKTFSASASVSTTLNSTTTASTMTSSPPLGSAAIFSSTSRISLDTTLLIMAISSFLTVVLTFLQ